MKHDFPINEAFAKDAGRLRFALNAAGIGVWEVDIATNTVIWDDRCRALFGLAKENELPYEKAIRYIHPDDVATVDHKLKAALRGEADGIYDATYRTLGADDGKIRWVNFKGSAYFDGEGQLTAFGGIAQEVSESISQRDAAQRREFLYNSKLQEEQKKLTELFDQTQVAVGILEGPDLRFRMANRFYGEILGRKPAELIGRPLAEAVPEVAGQGFDAIMHKVMETQTPFKANEMPAQLRRKGWLETVYLNLSINPMTGSDGSVSGVFVIGVNVSTQVWSRKALEESETRLNILRNTVPAMIFYIDEQERYQSYNQRFMDWFGVGVTEVVGVTVREFIGDPAYSKVKPYLLRAYAGNTVQYELEAPNRLSGPSWLHIVYTPHRDDEGAVLGIVVLATDITASKRAEAAVRESEARLERVHNAVPAMIFYLDEERRYQSYNRRFMEWYGINATEAIGVLVRDFIGEKAYETVAPQMDRAYAGEPVEFEMRAPGRMQGVEWLNVKYTPHFAENGQVVGHTVLATDITKMKQAAEKLRSSEARFRALVEEAPIATCLFTGREMRIEIANETFLQFIGKDRSVLGKALIEAMPELEGQPFPAILDEIYTTGETYSDTEALTTIDLNGRKEARYFDFTYKPLRNERGDVFGILGVSANVTDRVLSRREVEESNFFARSLIDNSPVAKLVLLGEELLINIVNRNMLELMGAGDGIVGQTFEAAAPLPDSAGLARKLREVYRSGETLELPEVRVQSRYENTAEGYYNFTCKPLRNPGGATYGIICTATNVTAQVLSRKKVEEAELKLMAAIEVAELATWNVDVPTKLVTYSPRLQQWLGLTDSTLEPGGSPNVDPEDRDRVREALLRAMEAGGDGTFDETYAIRHRITGQKRVIHVNARTLFDSAGQPLLLSGTAQDVTIQKDLQTTLEQEVQNRTEELQAAIEELADSNRQLQRSNDELAQYAYVASHDLQEPLRKISVFASRLAGQTLAEAQMALVDKIAASSRRMSLLIRDLLEFSRLLQSDSLYRSIDLNEVVGNVITDFELTITEKEAGVSADPLPVIEGVALQLNQLFYNLLGNALKFVSPERKPEIRISSRAATGEEVRAHVESPVRDAAYHLVTVADNGIGFDPQYIEQIFELFRRLHQQSEYAGTGIGLAICRRIAQNHKGALYADSAVGKGSSFYLLLPERRPDQ